MLVIGQKWLYTVVVLWQSGCFRAKVVVVGKKWFRSRKVVEFGQSCCIRSKGVVFGQKGSI